MSPREIAAFRAGILHASHMAPIAATEIELRDDASKLRQRSAIEALRGLAEGLKTDTTHQPAGVQHHADAQHA